MHVGKNYISSLPDSKYMLFDIKNMSMRVFESLIQDKIDRFIPDGDYLGMMPKNSLPCRDTRNTSFKMRSRIIRTCGISEMTHKMPLISKILKQDLQNVDFSKKEEWEIEVSHTIFKILANIFLGRNFVEDIGEISTVKIEEEV